jgi:hypothetical protein
MGLTVERMAGARASSAADARLARPGYRDWARVPFSRTSRHQVRRSHEFAPDRHQPSSPRCRIGEIRRHLGAEQRA